jgi:hypothetical protein
MRLIGHTDLNGTGDAMHVNFYQHYAYVGHMGDTGVGTSVVDVSDPRNPRVVHQLPIGEGVRSHKVQIVDDLLLVNFEILYGRTLDPKLETGFKIFSLKDPERPRQLADYRMPGHGVHRMKFVEQPYAYFSGSDEGFSRQIFMIFDLSDPTAPREVSRWWLPGMNVGAGERPEWHPDRWVWHHHSAVVGDRAYGAWWDAGVVILDIADKANPQLVNHVPFDDLRKPPTVSGATHSVLPLPDRDLLVVVEEEVTNNVSGYKKFVRILDISDEQRPRQISVLPAPEGDFHKRGGRFGPHNIHEMRPGTLQNSNELYVTYFNAGVRVYDISDPYVPKEVAYHVPPSPNGDKPIQMNDIIVAEDGLIYATDRFSGGLYIFERTD